MFSIKHHYQSNLAFFFKQRFPFSHMLRPFQDSFVFGEATSSHFFSVTTSTQQLLLRSSYFFRTTAFLRSSFFRTVTFSQQLFFQNSYFQSKTSTEQLLLESSMKNGNILHENRKFFKRVTFWNLFGGGIVQNKDIYRRAASLKQVLLHSIDFFRKESFWKKLIFQKSNISHYPLFLESYFFRGATFSKDATLYSSYLARRAAFFKRYFFRRVTILQQRFLSVATLLIYLLVIK